MKTTQLLQNMMMVLMIIMLSACRSHLPPGYTKAPGKILVVGNTSNGVQTKIGAVDDGEILMINGYELANQVWLSPGPHKLSISCEKVGPWGSYIDQADIHLDAKENCTYQLQASFPSDKPSVAIQEIPNP